MPVVSGGAAAHRTAGSRSQNADLLDATLNRRTVFLEGDASFFGKSRGSFACVRVFIVSDDAYWSVVVFCQM